MTASTPVHAFGDDALGEADATELAELIRTNKVSATEACEASIRRAEAMQPLVNAVEYPDYERARAAAGTIADGPFAGVPTFVKDNVDVAGMPTNQGTEAFVAKPAAKDSPVVTQLKALGVNILGKSRMPEFGFSASTEYVRADPVRNPWNLEYSSGASSGGAAALVATGVVPMAHANDGGGSTRIPAAVCGLVGLKPSRGRLLPDPADTRLPVPIITQGVLTRSVRDTARFYAGAEGVWRNPKLPPVRSVEGPSRTRLRVAMLVDSVSGTATDEETRACLHETATLLDSLGHHVEEIPMPVSRQFAEDFSLYWGVLGLLASRMGTRVFDPAFDVARTDNLTKGLAQMCRGQLARTPGMVYRLRRTAREYRRIFLRHDVLLSPVLSHTTPLLGHLSPTLPFDELFPRLQAYAGFTPLNNASGGPAISLPMGRSRLGLPIGCHFAADIGDERTLLELAFELESAKPWPRIQDSAAGATSLGPGAGPPG
ncbi:MAG TPA: amidase [Nocardioidaceae bacterium]|jgi:amidase|nr:amidase [Nocardioidaceae bacterium]